MIRPYSPKRARQLIAAFDETILETEEHFRIPADWLRAILFCEMTQIDLLDYVADFAVYLYSLRRLLHRFLFRKEPPPAASRLWGKKDSSTGWTQIFSYVAINAVNFALDHGIADYPSLGMSPEHLLDPRNPDDLWMVWRQLNRDRRFNLEAAALNLLSAAEEMNGTLNCAGFSEQEIKRVFSRYNANTREITPYGERAYSVYLGYRVSGGFTEDGYIRDQDFFSSVRYRGMRADINGCGWIAAYNLRHFLSHQAGWEEVLEEMDRMHTLRVPGPTLMRIMREYLREHVPEAAEIGGRIEAVRAAENSRAGIFRYQEGQEPHFIMFYRSGPNRFRFFNVTDGLEDYETDMEQFAAEHFRHGNVIAFTIGGNE